MVIYKNFVSTCLSVDITMANITLNVIYRFGSCYVMIDRSVRMAQIPKFVLFYQQYKIKLDGRSGVYVYL